MNRYDYQKYLQSTHWRKVKRDYAKQFKRVCYLCASEDNLELHHVTYERIGNERLTDVVYLCEICHGFIHGDGEEARTLRQWIDPVSRPALGINEKNVMWGKPIKSKELPKSPAKPKGHNSSNVFESPEEQNKKKKWREDTRYYSRRS